MRILLLEDESDAADRVREALAGWPGLELVHVTRGEDALKKGAAEAFDALIFDRMTESMDGLDALRRLRANDVKAPALILSNLGATRHRIDGLDSGADDYLGKPFDPEELVARLRALLRRATQQAAPDTIVMGALDVRLKARTVHWNGEFIDLSPKEFEILKFLAENRDTVVSREMLWDAVWPEYKNIGVQTNVVDVNLSRLRRKLETIAQRPLIDTVRKQGFVLRSNLGV